MAVIELGPARDNALALLADVDRLSAVASELEAKWMVLESLLPGLPFRCGMIDLSWADPYQLELVEERIADQEWHGRLDALPAGEFRREVPIGWANVPARVLDEYRASRSNRYDGPTFRMYGDRTRAFHRYRDGAWSLVVRAGAAWDWEGWGRERWPSVFGRLRRRSRASG